ncbi:MAG TPA: Rieske 2Fe-2S domain-containing protein [Burkholderiaceae bacterium]|nr:Rieske 2Fe-2S domain-containing protein [Burkholderiaceae bacterium]
MSPERNRLLTSVCKGTPLGDFMRRYWHPICASAELPTKDCDPLRTRLLGESFVVFRDSEGRVGVIDEACMHRGVSMALGRVEGGGIRCLYHGWKFDVQGNILEMPNHPDGKLMSRLRAPVYPAYESGGLIWTYIGDQRHVPPRRRFAFEDMPEANRVVVRINVNANYLQLWEGGIDHSHVTMLHSNWARPDWVQKDGRTGSGIADDMLVSGLNDTSPEIELDETDFGFQIGGIRTPPGETGSRRYVRVLPVFMPYGRIIPFRDFSTWVFEMPQDDEHTSTYLVDAGPDVPLSRDARLKRSGLTSPLFYKDNQFTANWSNRLGQDREAMRKGSWSGFHGISQEDAIMGLSAGPIVDRSTEHLVPADAAIARLRKTLLEQVEVTQSGGTPKGADIADLTRMRGFQTDWDIATHWTAIAPDHQEFYKKRTAKAA